MRISRILRSAAVTSACLGLILQGLISTELRAANGGVAAPVHDVSLRSGGRLAGVVHGAAGQPVANSPVALVRQGGFEPRLAVTDVNGRFKFDAVAAGVYQIAAGDSIILCRCWAPETAPPVATDHLLLVSDNGVERGQRPLAEALFSTPTLLVAMIAAAIIIPIAVHNSKNDAS